MYRGLDDSFYPRTRKGLVDLYRLKGSNVLSGAGAVINKQARSST